MSELGKQIRTLRKSEGLTQKDFSKRLLISQSYLSGLENGTEIPTDKLLKLICLEFGVNEDWLTDNTGDMYTQVYENDRSLLAETSNAALLKIMTLLSTKSNVEYGYYANALYSFASAIEKGIFFDEDTKLKYLELLQNFAMDLERYIHVTINNKNYPKETHEKLLIENLENIFTLFKA